MEVICNAKVSPLEEQMLNLALAGAGGFAGADIPWFRLSWAASDFIRDRDPDSGTVREYPRCFHEVQASYHLTKFDPCASAIGGEYLCTGFHLVDDSKCQIHRAGGQGSFACLCKGVAPTLTILDYIVPRLMRNEKRDQAATIMAKEKVKKEKDKKYHAFVDNLLDPMAPSYSGKMPEDNHPAVRNLMDQNRQPHGIPMSLPSWSHEAEFILGG
jgi:hypothetical protein